MLMTDQIWPRSLRQACWGLGLDQQFGHAFSFPLLWRRSPAPEGPSRAVGVSPRRVIPQNRSSPERQRR